MTVNTEVRRYPFGEPVRLDMDPLFARLRREEPVCRVELPYGGQGWLVTRYDDVRTVLADPRFSRAVTVDREDIPLTGLTASVCASGMGRPTGGGVDRLAAGVGERWPPQAPTGPACS